MSVPRRASDPTSSTANRTSSTVPRDRSSCTKSRYRQPLLHPHLRPKSPFVAGRQLPRQRGRPTCLAYLKVQLRKRLRHPPQQLRQPTATFKTQALQAPITIRFCRRRLREMPRAAKPWVNQPTPYPRIHLREAVIAAHILLLPCAVGPRWETRRSVRQVRNLAPLALQQETKRRGERLFL